jgi:hypothetical protein
VSSWGWSGTTELVNVRCFNAAGLPANSRYVVSFVD